MRKDSIDNGIAPIIGIIIATLALVLVAIVMFSGKIDITFKQADLYADSSMVSGINIKYEDITNVTYRDDFNIGKKVKGLDSMRLHAGDFFNQEFGKYKLYSYNSTKGFVIVEYKNGYLAFNLQSDQATHEAYETLLNKINK